MQTQSHVGIGPSTSSTGDSNNNNSSSNGATAIFPQPSQLPFDTKMGIPHSQSFVSPSQHFTQTSMVPSGCTGLPITQLSLAEMESIISPLTRRRSEGFVQQEVKLMIKEVEKRRHILLSMSPVHNRLKKRAWEEVAVSMALKRPHEPRRTGEQIKKKWENIVSKTKKKIREGQVTPQLDWNETNTMVMQFLAAATQEMRERRHQTGMYTSGGQGYEETQLLPTSLSLSSSNPYTPATAASFVASIAPPPVFPSPNLATNLNAITATMAISNSGTNREMPMTSHKCTSNLDAMFTEVGRADVGLSHSGQNEIGPEQGGPFKCKVEEETQGGRTALNCVPGGSGVTASSSTIDNSDEDDDDNDDDDGASGSEHGALTNSLVEPSGGVQKSGRLRRRHHQRRILDDELLQQARREHALRMEILEMRRQFWQLKINALLQNGNLQQSTNPS